MAVFTVYIKYIFNNKTNGLKLYQTNRFNYITPGMSRKKQKIMSVCRQAYQKKA